MSYKDAATSATQLRLKLVPYQLMVAVGITTESAKYLSLSLIGTNSSSLSDDVLSYINENVLAFRMPEADNPTTT